MGFVAVLLAVGIWSAFGSMDSSLTTSGVVLQSGERHTVLSGTTGIAADIPVRGYERVDEGALIVRLRLPGLDAQRAVLNAHISALEREADENGNDSIERLTRANRRLDALIAQQAVERRFDRKLRVEERSAGSAFPQDR